jgi:uncharacterized protein YidB (DUF937 family)
MPTRRARSPRGPNRPITPARLEGALGEKAIPDSHATDRNGADELLASLSKHLPRVIDHVTSRRAVRAAGARVPSLNRVGSLFPTPVRGALC